MRFSHALCIAAGALLTALAAPLLDGAAPTRAPSRPPRPDPRVDTLLARLEALEARPDVAPTAAARLEELYTRLDAVEELIRSARAKEAAAEADDPGAHVEIPPTQLWEARCLSLRPDTLAEALDAWTAIAEGTADPGRRSEAWFEIGAILTKLGEPARAAEAFGRVVDLIGLGEARGQVAAQRQGVCLHQAGDAHAAYRAFRRLADAPTLMHSTAPTIRHWTAVLAARTGDTETARRELRGYIADYDNEHHAAFRKYVEGAKELLATLEE